MQYGYDAWGRPMPPPQYNQYQPPQQLTQTVSRREYDDLLNMVSKLGERVHGEASQSLYNQNPVRPIQPTQVPQAPQTALIPVSSEDEAWSYPNDLNGNKQYFIDAANMTIYAKWVDSNIDLQRAVGKLQMITGDTTAPETVTTPAVDVAGMIKGVDEKVSELGSEITGLSDEITEIKALIGAASVFQVAKSKPKGRPTKQTKIVEDDDE